MSRLRVESCAPLAELWNKSGTQSQACQPLVKACCQAIQNDKFSQIYLKRDELVKTGKKLLKHF